MIDDHSREALMINIDTSLSARPGTSELDRLIKWRGKQEVIQVNNGHEFTSIVFEAWAWNLERLWRTVLQLLSNMKYQIRLGL